MSVDPLAAFGGQESWSPYAAMGNRPGMAVDPDGLIAQGFNTSSTLQEPNMNPLGFTNWALNSMGINLTRSDYGDYFRLSAQLRELQNYKNFAANSLKHIQGNQSEEDYIVVQSGSGLSYEDQKGISATVQVIIFQIGVSFRMNYIR